MSLYQNSIQAFIQILESPENLLTNQDWEELQQLPPQLPENDPEKISEILENWLKNASRSQLLAAYKQNLQAISTSSNGGIDGDANMGIGRSQSPNPPNLASESSKQLLDNAIKNNSPLADKQKSPPQESN